MQVPRILKQFQQKMLTLQLRFLVAKDPMSKDGVTTHNVLCHEIMCHRVQMFCWNCFNILGSLIYMGEQIRTGVHIRDREFLNWCIVSYLTSLYDLDLTPDTDRFVASPPVRNTFQTVPKVVKI